MEGIEALYTPRLVIHLMFLISAFALAACGSSGSAQLKDEPTATGSAPRASSSNAAATPAPTEVSSGRITGTSSPPEAPEGVATEMPVVKGVAGATRTAPTRGIQEPTAAPVQQQPSATPVREEADLGKPVRFKIDAAKVKVNAEVEHVGVTEGNAMDVPRAWENVAWYKLGFTPGEKGNSVLAGHLDSDTGPAVFWNLEDLKVGEEVSVLMDTGKTLRFRVTKAQVYYDEDAPLHEIFGPSDSKRLNLITCDGAFDPETKRYDRKLVVFTEMIDQ